MPYLDEFHVPYRRIGYAQVGGAKKKKTDLQVEKQMTKKASKLGQYALDSTTKKKEMAKVAKMEAMQNKQFAKALQKEEAKMNKVAEKLFKEKCEEYKKQQRKPVSTTLKMQRTQRIKNYNNFLEQFQSLHNLGRREAQRVAKETGAFNSSTIY